MKATQGDNECDNSNPMEDDTEEEDSPPPPTLEQIREARMAFYAQPHL